MQCRKILIAFDCSENAFRAVNYVGELVGDAPGFSVALLHVERLPDRDLFADEEAWKAQCLAQTEETRRSLEEARDMLTAKGAPAANVEVRYLASCRSPFRSETSCSLGTSIALEVLRIRQEEDFGTVVLGRRGVSKQEEFLFGSVSSKIVHHARDCAVWVVE